MIVPDRSYIPITSEPSRLQPLSHLVCVKALYFYVICDRIYLDMICGETHLLDQIVLQGPGIPHNLLHHRLLLGASCPGVVIDREVFRPCSLDDIW